MRTNALNIEKAGLGVSNVKTIDKYNIREATFMAMKSALRKLDPSPVRAVIDG